MPCACVDSVYIDSGTRTSSCTFSVITHCCRPTYPSPRRSTFCNTEVPRAAPSPRILVVDLASAVCSSNSPSSRKHLARTSTCPGRHGFKKDLDGKYRQTAQRQAAGGIDLSAHGRASLDVSADCLDVSDATEANEALLSPRFSRKDHSAAI